EVDLPASAALVDLIVALRSLPGGDLLPAEPLIAVNLRQAGSGTTITPGDELALLPPMAGG
ncbi:MAG TPA: MoaD/ThiS family protein, partial [Gemmatimonadales bacterium]|nr:MoaD/ThiS family protein [Gemmatimonadales bacterium]